LSLLAAIAVFFLPETFGQRFFNTIEEIENDSDQEGTGDTEMRKRSVEET